MQGDETKKELEITPQMVEAGEEALFLSLAASSGVGDDYRTVAARVFQAMVGASPLASVLAQSATSKPPQQPSD